MFTVWCQYLRIFARFFIQTYSQKNIFVIYIYSDTSQKKPGVLHEVGAGWIVQTDHGIIKAGASQPTEPLNTGRQFSELFLNKSNEVFCSGQNFIVFQELIEHACNLFNKKHKALEDNKRIFQELGGEILNRDDYEKRLTTIYGD